MPFAAHLVPLFAALMAAFWLWRALQALGGMSSMPDLTGSDAGVLSPPSPKNLPDLTVIVPARNEAESIAATLQSLLAQTGLCLQILAIDDRSSDSTGETMDTLAASLRNSPHTLEVIHVRELPDGWLGKPHAIGKGIERARASWLLLTDGDVWFAPEILAKALSAAIRRHADHFVVVPTLVCGSIGSRAMSAVVQVFALAAVRMWKVADPRARDAFGVGGFTLVRADSLGRAGGIDRLRMEVVEDVALGWLIKHHLRGLSVIALAPGQVRLRWIRSAWSIVGLVEKNAFAGLRYSIAKTLAACLFLLLNALVPLAALAAGPLGIVAALVFYAAIALAIGANRKLNGLSPGFAVLFAPSALILAWAFLRSMGLTLWRGGVRWRGTLYRLRDLKTGMVPFRLM